MHKRYEKKGLREPEPNTFAAVTTHEGVVDEFVEKLGQKGYYERIDAILDEYNENKLRIIKLENEGQ